MVKNINICQRLLLASLMKYWEITTGRYLRCDLLKRFKPKKNQYYSKSGTYSPDKMLTLWKVKYVDMI